MNKNNYTVNTSEERDKSLIFKNETLLIFKFMKFIKKKIKNIFSSFVFEGWYHLWNIEKL